MNILKLPGLMPHFSCTTRVASVLILFSILRCFFLRSRRLLMFVDKAIATRYNEPSVT